MIATDLRFTSQDLQKADGVLREELAAKRRELERSRSDFAAAWQIWGSELAGNPQEGFLLGNIQELERHLATLALVQSDSAKFFDEDLQRQITDFREQLEALTKKQTDVRNLQIYLGAKKLQGLL